MILFESSFKQCYTRLKQVCYLLIDTLTIEFATVCQTSNRLVKVCQDKASHFITRCTLAIFQDFFVVIYQYLINDRHVTITTHHAEISQCAKEISFTDIVVYQRCIAGDGTCFLTSKCFFKEVVQCTYITIESLQLLSSRHFPIIGCKVAGATTATYCHDISITVRLSHTTIVSTRVIHIGIRVCQIACIKIVQIASQLISRAIV